MALHCYTGKPGHGKTFHCLKHILQKIKEWCLVEEKTGEPHIRKLYTNLPLFPDVISDHLQSKYNITVDASKYIEFLDMEGAWWECVPEHGLIAVDEVHEHLGAENDKKRRDSLLTDFRNYVAKHRHRKHDLIMITQHLENVSIEVLRISERIVEIQNLKSGRIPFIGIEIADIDVVRKAFGDDRQLYRCSYGRVVGRSVKWKEGSSTHVITKDYFGLYDTHTESDSESNGDRPSIVLGRWDALKWFAAKHWAHMTFKLCAVLFCAGALCYFAINGPKILGSLTTSAMIKQKPDADASPGKPTEENKVQAAVAGTSTPANSTHAIPAEKTPQELLAELATIRKDVQKLKAENEKLQKKIKRLRFKKRIVALLPTAILLADGSRVDVGGKVSFDGEKIEVLKSITVRTGKVLFRSGRVIWLR